MNQWVLVAVIVLCAIGISVLLVQLRVVENPLQLLSGESGEYVTLSVNGHQFRAEVADSADERQLGLSGRSGLGDDEVLLFVFGEAGRHGIWMKDMRFAIDIFWLDAEGQVIHAEHDVSPDTFPTTFSPSSDAWYVVEANAGFAKRHDITVGTRFAIPDTYARP